MHIRQSRYFLIVTILPLFFILQDARLREPLHVASLTVLKPFLLAIHSGMEFVSNTRDSFVQFWKTFQSQKGLETRVAELESKLVHYDEAMKENDRLKKLLDFRNTLSGKIVAARVIGGDISPWRKTIILDKGEKQGIKKDMVVFVPEGLVGRVLEAGPSTSRVILLLDPDARVSAATSESRAQGIVAGQGSAKLEMRYLSLDSTAAVEEVVITSGLGGMFPKGIRIGTIDSLGRDADGLHLIATLRPFVAFSKLEEVLCLESSQKN